MPFKKRKLAKLDHAWELRAGRIDIEQNFDTAIKKACEIDDPAEKVIALTEIGKNIEAAIQGEKDSISAGAKKAENKADAAGLGTLMAGGGGALAGLALAGVVISGGASLIALPVVLGGVVGTRVIASKHANAVQKKLESVSDSHIKNLEDLKELVSVMANSFMENNVEKICKSPLHAQILTLPGIKDKFAAATVKHVASQKAPAEPVTKNIKIIKTGNKLI
jgi:hypothetical protein